MLVATPGQTTAYSTLHNSSSNGGGTNNTTAATSTAKKSSTNSTASNTTKPLNDNNNHATSTVTTKSSLNSNSNTNSTIHNYHSNTKNDNIVLNKLNNQNKSTAASSREIISSTKKTAGATAAAATHSLKTENSTNTITTKTKQLIQNIALILTTDRNSNATSIAAKQPSTDNKLQNNCNNSKTSVNKVTSSSSSTSHNANKVSTTTTSLNTLSNATAATTQSSSSASAVRGKYFSCSLSKLHTVAPTIIHRYPEERQHASSTDSLHKEMCHFKPIRVVPKTPFKSGSKSRGNSVRFPKACLATKKNEFVLKSNCDANNRKRKQQPNQMQNDKIIVVADEDDENEQENKEFHKIYKPKPSLTCLSSSFNTPNHTSAFVCLIADVKSFVNMQSIKQLASDVDESDDDSQIIELFRRKTQKPAKKQLQDEVVKETLKKRGYRQSMTKTATKDINKQNAKINNISKASKVAITKAKSLRNVGRAKSKTINLVALAATNTKNKLLQNSLSMPAVALTSKRTRKSQAAPEDDHNSGEQFITTSLSLRTPLTKKSTSNKSSLLSARKSSRLSAKELSAAPANTRTRYSTNQISTQTTTTKYSQKNHINRGTVVSFSPPMTRARLKHLTEQGKIVETVTAVAKKRKI